MESRGKPIGQGPRHTNFAQALQKWQQPCLIALPTTVTFLKPETIPAVSSSAKMQSADWESENYWTLIRGNYWTLTDPITTLFADEAKRDA